MRNASNPESSNHRGWISHAEGYWIPGLASLAGNDNDFVLAGPSPAMTIRKELFGLDQRLVVFIGAARLALALFAQIKISELLGLDQCLVVLIGAR
jgi:hypothetical protein